LHATSPPGPRSYGPLYNEATSPPPPEPAYLTRGINLFRTAHLAAVLAAATIAMPVAAQGISTEASEQAGRDGRFSIGITGGTLGIGPEAGYRVSEHFGVRANASLLSVSHGFTSDDIDYEGTVNLKSAGVMADVFPFGGGFRISAGVRINGNNGRAEATPTTNTTIGGVSFTPAQIGTLHAKADVKTFAPALTVGYGGSMRSGFLFGVEAGALLQGNVNVYELSASSGNVPADILESERQSIQSDVDGYKVYPILQFKLGYRF
jgi:hypothetical protein